MQNTITFYDSSHYLRRANRRSILVSILLYKVRSNNSMCIWIYDLQFFIWNDRLADGFFRCCLKILLFQHWQLLTDLRQWLVIAEGVTNREIFVGNSAETSRFAFRHRLFEFYSQVLLSMRRRCMCVRARPCTFAKEKRKCDYRTMHFAFEKKIPRINIFYRHVKLYWWNFHTTNFYIAYNVSARLTFGLTAKMNFVSP